jgi:hypothetical protein
MACLSRRIVRGSPSVPRCLNQRNFHTGPILSRWRMRAYIQTAPETRPKVNPASAMLHIDHHTNTALVPDVLQADGLLLVFGLQAQAIVPARKAIQIPGGRGSCIGNDR